MHKTLCNRERKETHSSLSLAFVIHNPKVSRRVTCSHRRGTLTRLLFLLLDIVNTSHKHQT